MRVDLHCHSEWSPDSRTTLDEIIESVLAVGVDVLALTDHDAVEGALELSKRAPFPVIVGEEVLSAEGEIIGLYLTEFVPPGLSPEETVDRIHAQGGIAYVPHPFDTVRGSTLNRDALLRIVDRIDAVEVYNSRCLFDRFNAEASVFASEHGLPGGAGSDAHRPEQIGMAVAEVPDFDPSDPQALLEALGTATISGSRLGALGRLAPSVARARDAVDSWRERLSGGRE